MTADARTEVVGVIGAGQMGAGIAQLCATVGYRTLVCDVSDLILAAAQQRIAESLSKLEAKQQLENSPESIMGLISYGIDLEDLSNCRILIESAFENFDTKSNILYKIGNFMKPTSHVASNTSSYSITSLAKMLPYPHRFIGLHFMNPPPIMELVEVIRGTHTDDETFDFFWKFALALGKNPIESKDSPGFILNRILIPMINEAIYLLQESVSSPEHIDTAMKLGAHHPIGPLALADLIGLDTVLAIMKTLKANLNLEKYDPSPLLEEYVALGFLGKKSGRGFFIY
ncbi:MAG: 3-hydroxybutyryl-CoA dehydrogenase [Holosporaceae bacterium]|jgi:3-hydroxybutyryl-CoA dehydrogenase|nr:3-hydroxybutyryl-CoA dehydrogenase [Holosporaceae bacterium]